ncbi:14919_t:CDS:2 [Acaulospora morrowiae]|uniref:14919_t:CDS:1 n=1 Tax=Acaulospora morrowiae TaxID=94023 RepID=A0A9N8WNN1_9GLOM|nr:14919_t:CDS:2 [Acaulospora morrowiae]
MDETYDSLSNYLVQKEKSLSPEIRCLIAIAGIPGSGKSTLSERIVSRINHLSGTKKAIVVPMDGFHYTKKKLRTFSDPDEALFRRGAHWTFDAQGLLILVERLRAPIKNDTVIGAPSFDHGRGDPVSDDIKIIIFEGLYLHLRKPPIWSSIASHMDELWFVQVDREIAKERIIKRHIKSHIDESREEAINRTENNDMINADYILNNSFPPTRIVHSIEETEQEFD